MRAPKALSRLVAGEARKEYRGIDRVCAADVHIPSTKEPEEPLDEEAAKFEGPRGKLADLSIQEPALGEVF
jgi:hypothetical protein